MVNDELNRVFQALAHPVRRAMLERLSEGPASVGELAAPHAMSAPAISKHLRVLETAGLIHRSHSGRVHHMHLQPGALADATRWIQRHARLWEASLDRLVALVETPDEEE